MKREKKSEINVEGFAITILSGRTDDYVCLTDMAKFKDYRSGVVVQNWLTTKYTVQFIGAWEQLHNQNFNVLEFQYIRNEVGSNGFIVSPSMWIEKTGAIGIRSSAGRYGGTYAHKDIAFEFATWLSPEFKLYLIKEFQRLKEDENKKLLLDWNINRTLSRLNYRIHTDAIKEHIIPLNITKEQEGFIYADEADVLNVALFGKTAKQWRDENGGKEGNIRDYASIEQLLVLANMESINAEFIRMDVVQGERLRKLNQTAITQMKSLVGNVGVGRLEMIKNEC